MKTWLSRHLERCPCNYLWQWHGTPTAIALAVGAVIGAAVAFWVSYKSPPWMEFRDIQARYVRVGLGAEATPSIMISGSYRVYRACDTPVIWRTEALATDGQIAIYGPRPGPPDLSTGARAFSKDLPLQAEIYPDGWIVRVIVTCSTRTPETVASPPAVVRAVPPVPVAR